VRHSPTEQTASSYAWTRETPSLNCCALLTAPSGGFTTLWERGRLDLTVEAHVLKTEFAPLFTDGDRHQARDRLEAYGWRPPG
jgi:hypothetical protein